MRYGLILLDAIGTFLHNGCRASARLMKNSSCVSAKIEFIDPSKTIFLFDRDSKEEEEEELTGSHHHRLDHFLQLC